nr:Uncharacterised protein [Klebsiella pneumoniae]
MKQNAKQESDRIVKEAGQIKDNAIGDANQLSAEAASKTKAIRTVSRRINRTPRRLPHSSNSRCLPDPPPGNIGSGA